MRNTQLGQFCCASCRRWRADGPDNTAKSAMAQLTRMLASELIRPSLRIRVNEIQPGYFPSESSRAAALTRQAR